MSTPNNLAIPAYTQGFGTASIANAFIATTNPGPTNIMGPNGPFRLGQIWINSTNDSGYILAGLNPSGGVISAVWEQFSSAVGLLDSLTGNIGVATPIAENINVVGTGGLITTIGSAGNLTISSTAGGFPITPFVVGPVGKAGYQTIQSAINAANTAGGGMVYVQPGVYTENLTWFTQVGICSLLPVSDNPLVTDFVQIVGNHTVDQGTLRDDVLFSASEINFVCTGNLFSSSLATNLAAIVEDCLITATDGYVFSMPNVISNSGTSFVVSRTTVINGGTFDTLVKGNLIVTDSNMGSNGVNPLNVGSAQLLATNSNFIERITVTIGTLHGSECGFDSFVTIGGGGSATAVLLNCVLTAPITFNGSGGGSLELCSIFSASTYVIDGNSTATIALYNNDFQQVSLINPALTGLQYTGTTTSAMVQTAPPNSNIATNGFGTITFGTPIQNALGYDVIVSGTIAVTDITAATINMGVGPAPSPATNTLYPTSTSVTAFAVYFSAYLPNLYYLNFTSTGTGITVSGINTIVTPV